MKAFQFILFLFSLNIIGFYVTNKYFTFPPSSLSGNGNPGLLIMLPLVILFVLSNILLSKIVYSFLKEKNFTLIMIIILLSAVFTFSMILLEIHFIQAMIEKLSTSVSPSISLVNPRTNNVFFNQFTFLLVIGLSLFITSLVILIKKTIKIGSK